MNHFDALSDAANATSFMPNVDLLRTEEAVHAFLDRHGVLINGTQLIDALAGESRVGLGCFRGIRDCLASPKDKHDVKFGALAVLTAMAWHYDPTTDGHGVMERNSSAAMSTLIGFAYGSNNRITNIARKVAEGIGSPERDTSTDDIQMTLLTHKPAIIAIVEQTSHDSKPDDNADKIIYIDDENLRRQVSAFPWIDSHAEDIVLSSRLVRGLNDTDVLIVDLSPFSSRMQPILKDARAAFSEAIFRSMELQQIARILAGDHSGYMQPFAARDPNLPDAYCAKNGNNNSRLRRLYVARIGQYDGKPVFARLGFSRTKQNQSELSRLLGYFPVHS